MPVSNRRYLIYALIFIIVFGLGFLPQFAINRELQNKNRELSADLDMSQLSAELAMAAFDAQHSNFGLAAERSSDFFTGLQKKITDTKDKNKREQLQKIANQNQETLSLLASNNSIAAEKLQQIYIDFYNITRTDRDKIADR